MSTSKTRFVMIGGFLGAGKTTALLRLTRRYLAVNRRVGVITNDQADQLVDTDTFRSAGFRAEEIPHGCFCCKFNDLVAAAGRLAEGGRPDVLLAEPVGSCTDLVATVIRPLKMLYGDRFSVAPYVALLDPGRAWQALSPNSAAGFSKKVTYLFKMQQHEADIVAINKVDTLSRQRLDELKELVARSFPKAEVLAVSARTGEGFGELMRRLDGPQAAGRNVVDVDYDEYAEGEARLGWLNATLRLAATGGLDVDRVLMDLLTAIREGLDAARVEPAHVKVYLQAGDITAVGNLVGGRRPPELSRGSGGARVADARLLINARVETAPDLLRGHVEATVAAVAEAHRLTVTFDGIEALTPARPVPTHRLAVD